MRPSEAAAFARPFGEEAVIAMSEARALLRTGRYAPHRGMRRGEHYRAACSDGGCLHLRVHDGIARLHRDRIDPRGSAKNAVRHTVSETPIPLFILGFLGAGLTLATALRYARRMS